MLPPNVEHSIRATATITPIDLHHMAGKDIAPLDLYPLMQWSVDLESKVCPLCAELDGQIIDRRSEAAKQFEPPLHINCRCSVDYIHRNERAARANFKRPSWDVIQKHGHFVVDPDKYSPLRVPNFVDEKEFTFKRVKDDTGEMVSVLEWNTPQRELPGLAPETRHLQKAAH